MLKNHTFFLFSSLTAWRGEMLYVARMQFFWNSQNIANLAFRFEDAAPDTHSRPTKPWPKPWTRKPRKKKNKKQK
jgi:hypothetical protein